MKTLLHVGCGSLNISRLPAFFNDGQWDEIRYDINPDVAPDIIGSSQDMSLIDDGAVDAVYSSHNIEHVWQFEVPTVLAEFRRVLREGGFLVVMCPDILQVAQAVLAGKLEQAIYSSPAGPITALDVMYGYQKDIARGNHYMAHKMAFTSDTLASYLLDAGFTGAVVLRDDVYGLHAIATATPVALDAARELAMATCVMPNRVFESIHYGSFADA